VTTCPACGGSGCESGPFGPISDVACPVCKGTGHKPGPEVRAKRQWFSGRPAVQSSTARVQSSVISWSPEITAALLKGVLYVSTLVLGWFLYTHPADRTQPLGADVAGPESSPADSVRNADFSPWEPEA
jgi:hypothetical protein